MTTPKYETSQVKAVIEALETLVADPAGVNLTSYSNLALPFNIGLHVKGFCITPRREGANTVATVEGADKALAYLRSLL